MTALLHPCVGFISQVCCINPLFALKSRCRCSVVAGGAGGDGVGSAVPRCFQCCIQFLSLMLLSFYHSTKRFMLSCSCWLSNDACYIPWFYQLRVFYAKCFVRNDEINCEIKSINNFVPQTYQFPMLHSPELDEMIYILYMCSEAFMAMCINFVDFFYHGYCLVLQRLGYVNNASKHVNEWNVGYKWTISVS